MEQIQTGSDSGGRQGDRRRTDRRGGQRRREDRRSPPPVWRRPAAYVAYGVVGTVLLVLLVRGTGGDGGDSGATAAVVEPTATPERVIPPNPLDANAVRDARTIAQFEALLAEGDAAVGQIVRADLYCGSITPVTVRSSDGADPRLTAMADGEGRVGAAECRWSSEARSSDFLLVVPPELAEEFARSPEVELNFVRRRRILANVEWFGRSEPLALRTSGLLRTIER